MKKKERVLLVQADTTQTLPMARNLSQLGYEVDAVVSGKLTYGYGTIYVSKKFIFQNYQDSERYYQFLKDLLNKRKYDYIIPMADEGAVVLSKYKDKLQKLVGFKMPDFNIFERGYDKHLLMEICREHNIPHPRTISIDKDNLQIKEIENLRYPILIKPNHSCGARGITYIENESQLHLQFKSVYEQYGECHLQEFIPSGGRQVEVQLYINENQELVQGSVISKFRWYPVNGGSSSCNESIDNREIIKSCHQLLKKIGWTGFADFDTIEDPRTGELLIMELNPRVPACVKTAFEAGINWADVIISEYSNKPHKTYSFKKNIILRHLGFECLWFLKSPNRFHTRPSWFNFFGKKVFYQDMNGWMDPLPFIYGTIGNIIKQLSPSFRKSKAGI